MSKIRSNLIQESSDKNGTIIKNKNKIVKTLKIWRMSPETHTWAKNRECVSFPLFFSEFESRRMQQLGMLLGATHGAAFPVPLQALHRYMSVHEFRTAFELPGRIENKSLQSYTKLLLGESHSDLQKQDGLMFINIRNVREERSPSSTSFCKSLNEGVYTRAASFAISVLVLGS